MLDTFILATMFETSIAFFKFLSSLFSNIFDEQIRHFCYPNLMAERTMPKFDPRAVWGTIIVPSIVAVAIFGIVLAVSDRLPEKVATHWSGSDTPDGFMSPLSSALIFLVLSLLITQIGWFSAATKSPLPFRRINAIATWTIFGLICAIPLGITLPQMGIEDPTTFELPWWWVVLGTLLGLAIGFLVARSLRDYSSLYDVPVTDTPPKSLPRERPTERMSVKYSNAMRVFVGLWVTASIVLLFFMPSVGVVFLLCTPLLLIGYETGLEVHDDKILLFMGCGPAKVRIPLDMKTVKYAEPSKYNWADGGGLGLRYNFDGQMMLAARSGEAVKIETTGTKYTVVVPDGQARAVAGDINARLDRLRA